MASNNPYTVTVKRRENGPEGSEKEIQVNPGKGGSGWTIDHKGGKLNFKTKDDVKTYLKRKYAVIKD